MSIDTTAMLGEVFCGILERCAFMFGEPVDKGELAVAGQPFVGAEMSFAGPVCGRLWMAVPRQACPQIAANVLGMEPDEPFVVEHATDSLKEILNVVCGNLMTAIAGDKPVFDLSIPQVQELDEPAVAGLLADPDVHGFVADETPVLLKLTVQGS